MTKAKKQAPIGVKIISVYYYAVFVFSAVIGLLAFMSSSGYFTYNFLGSLVRFIFSIVGGILLGNPAIELIGLASLILLGYGVLIGFILLISSVISFFIARSIWSGKNGLELLLLHLM